MSENVEDIFRLTPVQQGMLFHSLQAPDSVAYVQQVGVRFEGELDPQQFRSAWDSVIARNEVFRCCFVWEEIEHPVQVVRRTVEPQWIEDDWEGRPSDEQERALADFLERDRQRGIEFSKAPMMRFALFKLSANRWHLVWTLHHAISDGWSIHLALRQAFGAYAALSRGQSPEVSDPTGCSFRRFIQWRESRDNQQATSYWQQQLGDFADPLRLSGDAPSSKAEYHRLECDLSKSVTDALNNFTRDNRLSMATVVNGAWAFLLSRYCNRRDVVFGITVSGRPVDLPGADQIVGPLLNTLPLRVQVDGDAQLAPWLASIQSQQHDVRELEWSSLLDVQACSGIRRGDALFETIAVVTNYPKHQDENDGAPLRIAELHHHERSHYPLAFIVVPGKRLRLILIADAQCFDRSQVSKWLDYLAELVEAVVSCGQRTLRDLPPMPRDDRQRLEQCSVCPEPTRSSTWLDQFDAQVSQRPNDIAVCCGKQRISYGELNQLALRLANKLNQLGAKSGAWVGICMDRSVDTIVAVLGIHRAGAAYVPLDPSYPQERLNSMAEVASLRFVVTSEACSEKLPPGIPHTISMCALGDADAEDASTLPIPKPADLAYVIFTSGSTGQPRAVGLSHANLAHSTSARLHYYKEPVESFLLLSSLSFDSSVAGIFWTLSTGGKLCIPMAHHGLEPLQLQKVLATEGVTHLLCIPSLYRELLNVAAAQMKSLSIAIMAGESLPIETVREHFELLPNVRLFNEYGPTEASVWCTVYECRPETTGSRVPIGRAIESMKALIVDDNLQLLPVGVAGELIVGGVGTADGGYLGMAEATAERFVSLGGSNGCTERYFRTGDLARLRSDGELEFLGRNDRQVKIRGYRVELEGIEAVASQHPQVGEVVAAAVKSLDADDAKVERLLEHLEAFDPEVAESLLSQAEAGHEPPPPTAPGSDFQRNGYDSRKVAKGPRFELVLKANDSFVKPPRDSQREWLLDQAINEFRDDLNHLDDVARRFVSGHDTEREQYLQDAARAKLTDQQIMEDWQTPLMKVMAEYVTASHGDVLEIGFGRGVSATFVQEQGVKSHTIIEVNDHSVNHHFRAWQKGYPDRDIRLIHKLWQDAADELGVYDGILFHAFPLNEKEFVDYVVESVTFAEHFFPSAAEHLRPGGAFTYLTTEIDSLSRRHQRKLYEWFDELTMRVVPVTVPSNTRDQWWADSMVAVKAIKRK